MPNSNVILFALMGGIIPATFWLWFWLREDRLHPEPRSLIFLSFVGGMIAVCLALPAEIYVEQFAGSDNARILAWSAIEEILKLMGAYFAGLHSRQCDEPIDPMIYLITSALGFSALENFLFLIPSINESVMSGIITGNLRFVGASLLHVLTSGIIGLFFAFAFFKGRIAKITHLSIGLGLAITIHFLFNFFISNAKGAGTFIVFFFVWMLIIMLLAAFEKVKRLSKIQI